KALAVAHLEEALEQWDELIAVTRPLYRDMLLTHMIGRSSNLQPDATFHWEDLRPQVEADMAAARQARAAP
ncbi:MAG: hypothetical protein V2J14_04610, partial [Erythrobacter sp.]|nr:hypothetical protein [Erythrobacter sp.]